MRIALMSLLAAALLSVGCKDSGSSDKAKKLAALCVEATKQLESASSDNETFMQQMQNGMMACSAACDEKDDTSCKSLESQLTKLCGVSPDACQKLCASVESPSLKKYTCELGKK